MDRKETGRQKETEKQREREIERDRERQRETERGRIQEGEAWGEWGGWGAKGGTEDDRTRGQCRRTEPEAHWRDFRHIYCLTSGAVMPGKASRFTVLPHTRNLATSQHGKKKIKTQKNKNIKNGTTKKEKNKHRFKFQETEEEQKSRPREQRHAAKHFRSGSKVALRPVAFCSPAQSE